MLSLGEVNDQVVGWIAAGVAGQMLKTHPAYRSLAHFPVKFMLDPSLTPVDIPEVAISGCVIWRGCLQVDLVALRIALVRTADGRIIFIPQPKPHIAQFGRSPLSL